MSFSLMMPQKYCGFSTKLDKPESSSEEGGLVPKFMKRSDTARSSSVPNTDEPNEQGGMQTSNSKRTVISNQLSTLCDCSGHQRSNLESFFLLGNQCSPRLTCLSICWYHGDRWWQHLIINIINNAAIRLHTMGEKIIYETWMVSSPWNSEY